MPNFWAFWTIFLSPIVIHPLTFHRKHTFLSLQPNPKAHPLLFSFLSRPCLSPATIAILAKISYLCTLMYGGLAIPAIPASQILKTAAERHPARVKTTFIYGIFRSVL